MDVAISGPLESWFTGNKCGQEVLQPQLTRMALSAETPRVPGQDGDLAACSWCCCPPHPPRTPLHGQAGHQLGSPRAFGVELRIGVIWFKSLALSPASWGWPQLVPLGVWGEQEFPPAPALSWWDKDSPVTVRDSLMGMGRSKPSKYLPESWVCL